MRISGIAAAALLAACLVASITPDISARGSEKAATNPAAKARKKPKKALVPARPSGVVIKEDPTDAYYGGTRNDTITTTVNELGQTVYSIRPSHFDISPPLSELARTAGPQRDEAIAEHDTHERPRAPQSRILKSPIPDPVVQKVVEAGDPLLFGGGEAALPTTGFNFAGVESTIPGAQSDANGAAGNNQFVQTVNVRYQIWNLTRATNTATPVFPTPLNINTIWTGFGGLCETTNAGDPIVLFDRTAGGGAQLGRWLISQITKSASDFQYYQCVAVSTTKDATGTYARYAFAVPNGRFADYPHISVWPDGYYMSAHGLRSGPLTGIFAAMDRAKMTATPPNPAATWLVIEDPNEWGHLPADLDGFTHPPSKAPGIFVSLHPEGMYVYRMKTSFSAGIASRSLQGIVPTAPATDACAGSGSCIPQPDSSVTLDSLSGLLMYRAAYRNFVDHESVVVTHAVEPGIAGVVSGVRWYDIRISGAPSATCPTYPCIYQQGTIADAPNGRSRWMSSMAMDSAENMLVGYSTTGKIAGSDNNSLRYTGRAKNDPPGLMTVPEAIIATGVVNNTLTPRWGDYQSVAIDPFDDCTFWFTGQYMPGPSSGLFGTKIASAVYPAGTGAGQCQPATCTTRPTPTPQNPQTSIPADNTVTVTWTGSTPTPGGYAIERADGVCGTEGLYQPLGAVPNATTTFTDTNVQGSATYAYRIRGTTDAAGKCNSLFASTCVNATATGNCTLDPTFAGATAAASAGLRSCGVTVDWTPAASSCLAAPNIRYNIYRSTDPEFVPSAANRIATCVVGPNSYIDTINLQNGTTYHYVVRAEDGTAGNGGPCGGGNEDTNSVHISGTPYGAGTQSSPGSWTDSGGDVTAQLSIGLTVTNGFPGWRLVKTSDDPGANHTPGGAYAYRNAGPLAENTYAPSTCAQLEAPELVVAGASVNLTYWERHQLEYRWDGVAVEYSVNNGPWLDVPAPSNSPSEGCDPADSTTDIEVLTCIRTAAGDGCDFPETKPVFTGPFASGAACADFATIETVPPYARRCHQVTGLNDGDSIRFRWQFSSEAELGLAGFYVDDVEITNIYPPNACVPNTCPGQANGTACDDGDSCTTGDVCGSGSCAGTAPPPLGEATGVSAAADKATYSWAAVASATSYDVVRGSIASFPVGPGGADEVCFGDLAGPAVVDATTPSAGGGFWYLARGQSACSSSSYGQRSNGSPRVTTTCP